MTLLKQLLIRTKKVTSRERMLAIENGSLTVMFVSDRQLENLI